MLGPPTTWPPLEDERIAGLGTCSVRWTARNGGRRAKSAERQHSHHVCNPRTAGVTLRPHALSAGLREPAEFRLGRHMRRPSQDELNGDPFSNVLHGVLPQRAGDRWSRSCWPASCRPRRPPGHLVHELLKKMLALTIRASDCYCWAKPLTGSGARGRGPSR